MATTAPPLTDRTLKYGRNVIAVSGVIIVLACVRGISFESFQPFGLPVAKGNYLSVWGVLFAVLVYYAFSFGIAVWLDVRVWMKTHGADLTKRKQARAFVRSRPKPTENEKRAVSKQRYTMEEYSDLRYSELRLWCIDIGFPGTMFVGASVAVFLRVFSIWPG